MFAIGLKQLSQLFAIGKLEIRKGVEESYATAFGDGAIDGAINSNDHCEGTRWVA